MQQTRSYNISPSAAVPFFRSRWGLLSLLAVGSGLYLYQRRGGSVSGIFSRIWSAGVSARTAIGNAAPSVSGLSESTGDVGSFGSSPSMSSSNGSRQTSPNSGI